MAAPTSLLAWAGSEDLAARIASQLGAGVGVGAIAHDRFPDGESRLRVEHASGSTAIVAALDRPDAKLLPLLLAADAARGAGAQSVGLVAPYLPYMRQDKRFRDGEPLSARVFGRVLASGFDWAVTLDPHLHRIESIAEILPITMLAGSAAEELGAWVRSHAPDAACVGPDEESEQWVAAVARAAGTSCAVFLKERLGDRSVRVTARGIEGLRGGRAILIDDIVSSGRTLIEAAQRLRESGVHVETALAVHAIFAPGSEDALHAAGLRVVTCDGIQHPTNGIPVAGILAELIRRCGDSAERMS